MVVNELRTVELTPNERAILEKADIILSTLVEACELSDTKSLCDDYFGYYVRTIDEARRVVRVLSGNHVWEMVNAENTAGIDDDDDDDMPVNEYVERVMRGEIAVPEMENYKW